ncbi:MAG TPA: DUF4129 domain-containing protein [Steroidobacteraceae bacterium]|jgi:hypothetical protein|nr:DUF4129 domain-containing protein [Steroidobacteraceae bacterium]
MLRALLALVLMSAVLPAAAARDALGVLDDCIHRLDAELDVGYRRIAARCPDLAPSLAASPWGPWLPSDWSQPDNNLSAAGLRQLRVLIGRETARAAAATEPRVERVAGVLTALRASAGTRAGWWARLRDWLREIVRPAAVPADDGWLRRLFAGLALPGAVARLLTLGALALVALLAGVIVAGELRAAGVLRRWRRPAAPAAAARGAPAGAGGSEASLERAAPAQQPRVLLELIAARLAAQQRLPATRALTVHELLRAARLADPEQRARLAELASTCERLRFSPRLPPPETVAAAVARGRELLAALEARFA